MGLLSNEEHAYQFIIGNVKIPLFYMPNQNPNVMEITDTKEYKRTQTIGGQAFEHWGEQPATLHISMRIRKNSYAGNLVGMYNEKKYDLEDPMICTELEALKAIYHFDRRPIKWNIVEGVSNLLPSKKNEEVTGLSVVSVSSGSTGNILSQDKQFKVQSNSGILSGKKKDSGNSIIETLNKISDTIIIYKAEIYSGFFKNFKIIDDAKTPFFNTVTFDFIVTSRIADYAYEFLANSSVGRTIFAVAGVASTASALTQFGESLGEGIDSLGGLF